MKRSLLALGVGVAFGLAGVAHAAPVPSNVNINPDAGGVDPLLEVSGLDWAPGNVLVTPVTSASGTVANPSVGDVFQIYGQTVLGTFTGTDGNPIGGINLNGPTPATNYEWTLVVGFQEQVTGTGANGPGNTLNSLTVAGGINFFEVYYDANRNANPLAGTGFNDGSLILRGTIDAGGTSAFTRNLAAENPGGIGNDLDKFVGVAPTDDWPGVDSINGDGNITVRATVSFWDPAFFTDPIMAMLIDFTSAQKLAFNNVDPSALFVGPGGVAPTIVGVPSVGTCNGCVAAFDTVTGGPNVMFEQDGRSTFLIERVPEPATLALMGLGLAGLGFSTRRRKAS